MQRLAMQRLAIKKSFVVCVGVVGGLILWLGLGAPLQAYNLGINGHSGNPATNFGMSCNACHGGGSQPTVFLTGPQTVDAGDTVIYTLSVQSAAPTLQTAAGLDVSATAGAFASLGPDTQLLEEEITHSTPKNNDAGGLATFSFYWTAPPSAQVVTLYAAGNSVNMNNNPGGDDHANTTLSVEVTEPSAVQLSVLTASPTPAMTGALLAIAALGLTGARVVRRTRTESR